MIDYIIFLSYVENRLEIIGPTYMQPNIHFKPIHAKEAIPKDKRIPQKSIHNHQRIRMKSITHHTQIEDIISLRKN